MGFIERTNKVSSTFPTAPQGPGDCPIVKNCVRYPEFYRTARSSGLTLKKRSPQYALVTSFIWIRHTRLGTAACSGNTERAVLAYTIFAGCHLLCVCWIGRA